MRVLVADAVGPRHPRRVPRRLLALGPGPMFAYLLADQPPVSNARARQTLGWTPAHPTWRQPLFEDLYDT